jgi:uncharacterized protein RhaS with RHS repeats
VNFPSVPEFTPATATGSYTPGTIGYTYDANGNLASKTDTRGIVTTYAYDGAKPSSVQIVCVVVG